MSVNFIYEKGINHLDLMLFNEILLNLKLESIKKEELDIIDVTYDYGIFLQEYTREQIINSINNIFHNIYILKDGSKEKEHLTIGIEIVNDAPKVIVQFFNVFYLKENFFKLS